MKKDIKDFMVMLAVGLVFALIVGAVSGIVQKKIMDNHIEKLDCALHQVDEAIEIQKLSEYKGEMKAVRDFYLENSITHESARAKTTAIINEINEDYTGFGNSVEVSIAQHAEVFPEMAETPIVLINETINQINDLINEIKE